MSPDYERRTPVYMTRPMRVLGLSLDSAIILVATLFLTLWISPILSITGSFAFAYWVQKRFDAQGLPNRVVDYTVAKWSVEPWVRQRLPAATRAVFAYWLRKGSIPPLPAGRKWSR